jgi:ABC-2 type transport system permease protein
MSRWRSIWLVARREILERGRSRAFLLSILLTTGFLLVGIFLPSVLGGRDRAGTARLGIAGSPPAGFETILDAASSAAKLSIAITHHDEAAGRTALEDGFIDALLVVPSDGSAATYVVKARGNELLGQVVSASLAAARIQVLLSDAGIDPGQFLAAQTPPRLVELEPSDPNRETTFLFANVGVILLFISIFTFGTWVLTGVVEEKQSRVVEVVLSTIAARDLLMGKILGIGLLGLFQLVVMVSAALAAGTLSGRFSLPPTTGAAVFQLILWFGLGYALYATALGVLGALASRMEEASNASAPVSILASIAYGFSLIVAVDDPSGVPARSATLIPPVAPMVVPLRAALGAIEPWEIALSAALTIATIWVLFVVGGRVYSGAVLSTGGRLRLRDAWRASRN